MLGLVWAQSLARRRVERLSGLLLEQRMRCEDCGDAAGVRSRCDAHCVLHLPPPPEEGGDDEDGGTNNKHGTKHGTQHPAERFGGAQ